MIPGHRVMASRGPGVLVGRAASWVLEAQDRIVAGVGQFVQCHHRLLGRPFDVALGAPKTGREAWNPGQ